MLTPAIVSEIWKSYWVTCRAQPPFWIGFAARGSLLCTTWTSCLDRASGQAKHNGAELNRRTTPKWVRIQPALTAGKGREPRRGLAGKPP
jgi:hypothetical protein